MDSGENRLRAESLPTTGRGTVTVDKRDENMKDTFHAEATKPLGPQRNKGSTQGQLPRLGAFFRAIEHSKSNKTVAQRDVAHEVWKPRALVKVIVSEKKR